MHFLHGASPTLIAAWNAATGAERAATAARAEAASTVDQAFRKYAEAWAIKYWENPRVHELWSIAEKYQTTCLNGGVYQSAYDAGRTMIAYNPIYPLGWIYTGDVFWRTGKAFIALDTYYAPQVNNIRPGSPEAVMVFSRIAESHEKLGRIREARDQYLAAAKMPYSPNLELTIVRGRLKADYYTLTEGDGTWASDESAKRLNRYVHMLQDPAVHENIRAQCGGGRDFACMAALWRKQYASVPMREELRPNR
jgi:hypothetical protein